MRSRNITGKEYGFIRLMLSKDHNDRGSKYNRVALIVRRSPETVRNIALSDSFHEFETKKAQKVAMYKTVKSDKKLIKETVDRIREKRKSLKMKVFLVVVFFVALFLFVSAI